MPPKGKKPAKATSAAPKKRPATETSAPKKKPAAKKSSAPKKGLKRTRKARDADDDGESDVDDIGGPAPPAPTASPLRRSKRLKKEPASPLSLPEDEEAPAEEDGVDVPADDAGDANIPDAAPVEVDGDGDVEAAGPPAGDEAAGEAADIEGEDDDWDATKALATSHDQAPHASDRANGEITVEVKVFPDPGNYRSRLGYKARATLTGTLHNAEGEDIRVDDEVIGTIDAWRISRPRQGLPHAEDAWVQEILAKNDKEDDINETSLCMRRLFTYNGHPKAGLKGDGGGIHGRNLMFLQLIHLKPQFRSRGLVGPVLRGFYEALARLPEWFVFQGSLVLVPGRPAGDAGDDWGDLSDGQVEKVLVKVYKRVGYVVWASGAAVANSGVSRAPDENPVRITVMGVTIPEEEEGEGEGEDGEGAGEGEEEEG